IPVEIREKEVVLKGPDGRFTIENDFVLAMTGYQPNFDLIHRLGIELSKEDDCTPAHNPDTLETNLPNVYLAGVVCAGMATSKLFIENTRDHGEIIIDSILQKREIPARI
ncbi:MAG: NAD(P)-binding domain-containing protein, partial [Saprospiraceae bacterium]|nr:NAD(P)-binding domain-containing protein [Saprospiraceae bacterium]